MLALPNERSTKILSILLDQEEAITIKDLAEEFEVSARTIRSDLKKLEDVLNNDEIKLIKKPRVGVWLEVKPEYKNELKNELFSSESYKDPFSSETRQKYILKCLLQSENKYTMKSLGEELYVSRTTIYNDLEDVEKWLNKYDLILERKQNYGVEVKGEEKNWRRAVADLLAQFKDNQELKAMLEDVTDPTIIDSRIDNKTYQQLRELFKDINFRKIENILEQIERESDFVFTDEAFVGLVIHIAISLKRLIRGKDIKMEREQLNSLKETEEFEIAKVIAKSLEEELDVQIPEAELGYISLHILGSKVQQNIISKDINDVLENTDQKVIEIAKDIIYMAGDVLGVNLSEDEQLLLGLVLHLRPAINRLKYGMSLRNPILDEIKNNYPSIFGAAWATSIVFEKHLGIKVNEEEIGYIALHLGAALERNNNKIKVIVVCSSGIGTSQLVATRLRKRLAGIEIVDLISVHELKNRELEGVDIIVSTIPINDISKPLVQVSALLTEDDIKLIKSKINYLIKDKENQKLKLESVSDEIKELFDDELIYINLDLDSKEEIIRMLSTELLNRKLLDEGFIVSALEREKITSTAVGNEVAIPHGKESYVLNSKIAVATLAKPVKWGNEKVSIILLLALEKEKSKNFFRYFHRILDNKQVLEAIKRANTKEDIKNLLFKR
ncbi:transcriptional antiterminator [Orenia metallireducens]|uniref:Transcriptional antiterminator n=1 Tax=Orenia metallireducens TaxID=1413210 RepID=A0A285FX55_9FIRM|nr:BglG family transcription antiterminator [Orenia metallireducens]PRX35595.1 transcriptional antiterminator [Orenia metallireducens]SNY15835.1 Transcriptional antiterminator [Orenia metallireducens]